MNNHKPVGTISKSHGKTHAAAKDSKPSGFGMSSPWVSSERSALELCNSYIRMQMHHQEKHALDDKPQQPGPAITISYQAGSGAHEIAERLAEQLQASDSSGDIPWTTFDHHLVARVLEDHHLPQSLAKFMTEDRRSYLQDVIEEIAGLRPPSWVTVPLVTETVLHLANSGHVILVGRGANVITARMPNVFHVHLIAPLPQRIAHVQKTMHLSSQESAKWIDQSDRGRGRYAKAHFHACLDDALLYHLVINTDRIPIPDAVELIAAGALKSFQGDDDKRNADESTDLKHLGKQPPGTL